MAPSSFHIPDFDSDLPTPPPTHHLVLKKEPFPWDVASAASTSTAQPTAHFRGKRILVIGLTIFTAIALLLVGLFIQIFVTHEYLHQDLVIITTAPLGPTLSIVHVLSILLVMSVPLVVGLEGYRLAGLWLSASASSGHNRPTPFQLGVLMNVLHGANFAALFEGLHYVYGFGKNKLTSYKPPLLRRAVFVLAFALGVSTLFFVLGTALSISAETTSFTRLSDYRGTWPQLSRQINSSMCADSNGAVAADINLCGLQVAGTNPFAASLPEALQTLTNTSTKNAVAFASDQTAFIVPASIPQDVVYSAASYGIYTQCESVTELCVGSGPSYGPDTSLDLNCPASVSFNPEPVSGTYVFGVLDNNGNLLTQPYLVDSNPFHFGAVVASKLYTSENDTFVGTTGFFTHGTEGAYNVLSCTVSVRSLTYSYSNGSYLVQSTQMDSTNLDLTRTVAAMSGSGPLPSRVSAAVEGAGLASGDYASAFAAALSRELIGLTAALYAPADALALQRAAPAPFTRLPFVPLALLAACAAAHALFVLVLTLRAACACARSAFTLLARNRLADPFTAVHAAYGRLETHRTWERSKARLFSSETGLDRLSVGPTTTSAAGLAFGVSRAVAAPSVHMS